MAVPLAAAGRVVCSRCRGQPRAKWAFSFDAPVNDLSRPVGEVVKCFRCALRHLPMLKRSLRVALIVGTLLTALNQGNVIVAGDWSWELIWKIPLTYCVPFCVATYAALSTARR